MKLLIEIDTANPPTAAYLRSHADYLSHIADNHAEFFNNAPGNAASIFGAQKVTAAAAPVVTPPAPPAAPAPTNNGDGSATDLLRPATPPAPPPGDVDKTGLPWDARIHAGTKSKNGDGTWKKRKGVEAEEVARVTAELMGSAPAAAAAPTPPAPPPPAGTPAPTPPAPPAPPVAPAATPAVPPAPPAPPAAPAGAGDVALRKAIIDAVSSKKLTIDQVNEQCMNFGFGNIGAAFDGGCISAIHAALGL